MTVFESSTGYKTRKNLKSELLKLSLSIAFVCDPTIFLFQGFFMQVLYYSLPMGKEFYFLSGVFRSLVNVTELVRTYLNISSRKKVLQDFIRESDNNVHFISSVARLSLRIIMISAALLTAIVKLLFEKALYYLEVSFFKVFNNVWLFCDCKVS